MGEPLVIHPRLAGNIGVKASGANRARHRQQRERNVVRSVAHSGRLLAHPVFALNDKRLLGRACQVERKSRRQSSEGLPFTLPKRRPVPVPDAPRRETRSRDAGAGAIEALSIGEAAPLNVGKGSVRKVNIVHAPCGWIRVVTRLADSKENQLKAESVTSLGPNVPGVIPPLSLEIAVLKVIARKFKPVARQSFAIGSAGYRQQRCAAQDSQRGTFSPCEF